MYCKNCGQQIADNSKFCNLCGTIQKQPQTVQLDAIIKDNKPENKFKKFIIENKWFVVCFLFWSFIHILLLLNGDNGNGFWPFNENTDIDDYGIVEFFFYETFPILIFIIIKLVGKDIKKAIEENN